MAVDSQAPSSKNNRDVLSFQTGKGLEAVDTRVCEQPNFQLEKEHFEFCHSAA